MNEWIELLNNQNIIDLDFPTECKDEFIDTLNIVDDIGESYFVKAEELFIDNKMKAFDYYKLSYKSNYLLAPYMIGLYFEYGLGELIKAPIIAIEFYKESINRDDFRGYVQIAGMVDEMKDKLILWKKFFESDFFSNGDFNLTDFANYNIDYRALFLYKFRNQLEYEKEIREILEIIKPSIIKDYEIIVDSIQELLKGEISDIEEDIFNEILYVLNLVKSSNEDELFISNEDMGEKLEKLLKKDKKWD